MTTEMPCLISNIWSSTNKIGSLDGPRLWWRGRDGRMALRREQRDELRSNEPDAADDDDLHC
jgi:hypothetical protein